MAVDIRKPLKKFLPHLLKAQEENLNEADTRHRLVKFFEDVLGYDSIAEITGEMRVKERFVDLAIKLDGVIRLLIEVKAAKVVLRDRHIEQAQNYAAHDNIRWVLLTNGIAWNLYHLTFEEGIEYELVFTLDLASDQLDKAASLLALLHRQSIRSDDHEKFWQKQVVLGPASIGKVLFCEDCLRFMRRELRKQEGILIDIEDLARALHLTLSTEARERIGPLKIIKRKKKQRPHIQKGEDRNDSTEIRETAGGIATPAVDEMSQGRN